MLVSRNHFFEGEKLCLQWRGPRRIIKALNDYTFRVEDLRTGDYDDVHGTLLKFYRDADRDEKAIMSDLLSSKTGIPVARLLLLIDLNGDLFVVVR